MVAPSDWTKKKVLITVRTYPAPSRKDVEVSCTAGITEYGEWIRLFPIPTRFLEDDKQFKKYQLIEVEVTPSSDVRPESYRINVDSIRVLNDPLPTANYWQERKDYVLPLMSSSLCELQRQQKESGYPTLGLFKPREVTFDIEREENDSWTESELAKLSQSSFFDNSRPKILEKIPFKFRYQFRCVDAKCTGHNLSCTDWELGQSYRSWRTQHGDDWQKVFRSKYELEMILKKDLHFYVGTVHQYPDSWIIVGLFYPPIAPERLPGF